MAVQSDTQNIVFPVTERKVQSPYLYLQSVGSTGVDGSTYGAHVRWMLLRNLGDTHLPKGSYAATTINFNRKDDVVRLFRSRYVERFPTIIDFSVAPDVVNDPQAFWIYTQTNTDTTVYVRFRDAAKYAAVRAAVNPAAGPLQFIQQYCPALVEVEMQDKLFFAAEFDVARDAATILRAEALSVETNEPLAATFVSCRRKFTDADWCGTGESAVDDPDLVSDTPAGGTSSGGKPTGTGLASDTSAGSMASGDAPVTGAPGSGTSASGMSASDMSAAGTSAVGASASGASASGVAANAKLASDDPVPPGPAGETPACCGGTNLLVNGGFEHPEALLGYETDYAIGLPRSGAVHVVSNAASVNSAWQGLPHTGRVFLVVDGSKYEGYAVLRFTLNVDADTDYCFTGWLSTLLKGDPPIPLRIRCISADGSEQTFDRSTPATVPMWEQFTVAWNSGTSRSVTIEIYSLSTEGVGNDFGIDDLCFCRSKGTESDCRARMRSENIRSVRFDIAGGYPRRIELEAYDDYITGALWNALEEMALTTDDATALARLEPAPGTVNERWRKFNDGALLNVLNYEDRWTRDAGLRDGVERYIELSNIHPKAMFPEPTLQEQNPIQISLLDTLRMVALDFHAARMLGLGYLDRDIAGDTEEFIYLAVYDTDGALDDTRVARPVRHYFMGVPTRPTDYRLPETPRLKPVTYGLTVDNGEQEPAYLTDPQGYTPDGIARYVNLFVEPEVDVVSSDHFFVPSVEFCAIDKTSSVFYGIEYRKQGEPGWRTPEIAHDTAYEDLDTPPQFETLPLPNNHDPAKPILRHEERENGVHEYAGYGINWFSRASTVGAPVATDTTAITKANRLLPPSNMAVQLIQQENPLMLTTDCEQHMLVELGGPDRTLVRVTFDYFHTHDLTYDFADTVQLVFRTETPRNVVGAVTSVIDDPADSLNAVLRTGDYIVNSQGTRLSPTLAPALYTNLIGGVLSCGQQNYIITDIALPGGPGEGPRFTVRKNVRANASDPGSTGTHLTVQEYIRPEPGASSGQLMFMAVENMADIDSWGIPKPPLKTITIGDGTWTAHQETYVQDGETITVNMRGVVSSAEVAQLILTDSNADPGVYRIAFDTYVLQHHPQHADADPVDWYKGVVRIPTVGDPDGPKKVLEVLLVQNLGGSQPLVLHALDNAYSPNNPGSNVLAGAHVDVNYYPGYRAYLHADTSHGFTEAAIMPAAGEGNRKTWLGARSCDSARGYFSPVGIPAPIVALEFVEPKKPGLPRGAEYATRPDFYYKSSYTFRMNFADGHKPFTVVMYRANDEAVLRALYKDDTYDAVRQQLDLLGEGDTWSADRWRNLLGFDYVYDVPGRPYYDPTGASANGQFRTFDGYAFPNPDRGGPLNGSPPGTVPDALMDAVHGAFTPLTELPLLYDYIKGPDYVPVPRPQRIRDDKGTLLTPDKPEFAMAPMAKRTGNGTEIQFTDFTLDGTGTNIFFYFGREIGNRGRFGEPGPIHGPVRLINTRPPEPPGIRKVCMQEPDPAEGTGPVVRFEVNAYPAVQGVERMLVYRAADPANPTAALSLRTMDLVKTVDLVDTGQLDLPSIRLSDDFESGFVPYGDPLFYRIVALRRITNPEGHTEWAPSLPSKLLLTTVVDTLNPDAPDIGFTSGGLSGSPAVLTDVVLSWPATVHNGTYYLEKMNNVGDWVTIYRMKTNSDVVVNLAATDLGTDILPKENEDDARPIYNRFRVRVENSSGLFNLQDKVLTI